MVGNGTEHLEQERFPGHCHLSTSFINKESSAVQCILLYIIIIIIIICTTLPVEDVELFDEELDAARYQVVGHVVAVYLHNGGHDQQVSVGLEDVLELVGGVDDGGHAVSDDHAVPGMEGQAPVEDVQEELDVLGVGEISRHCLEHPGYQADPVEFVEYVNSM